VVWEGELYVLVTIGDEVSGWRWYGKVRIKNQKQNLQKRKLIQKKIGIESERESVHGMEYIV
jgi:hypothetical protein